MPGSMEAEMVGLKRQLVRATVGRWNSLRRVPIRGQESQSGAGAGVGGRAGLGKTVDVNG